MARTDDSRCLWPQQDFGDGFAKFNDNGLVVTGSRRFHVTQGDSTFDPGFCRRRSGHHLGRLVLNPSRSIPLHNKIADSVPPSRVSHQQPSQVSGPTSLSLSSLQQAEEEVSSLNLPTYVLRNKRNQAFGIRDSSLISENPPIFELYCRLLFHRKRPGQLRLPYLHTYIRYLHSDSETASPVFNLRPKNTTNS